MKRRLCFIGNSHLAAMKLGWDDVKQDYPSIEIEFFGSQAESLVNTRLNGAAIEPTDAAVERNFLRTAGISTIDTGKFDGFYIFATGFSLAALAPLYDSYGVWTFNGRRPYLISEDCFEQAGRNLLGGAAAMHVARLILTARDDARVVVSPQPLPAPPPKAAGPRLRGLNFVFDQSDEEELYGMFERICRSLESDRLSIKLQPEHTRTNVLYTKVEYSEGSVRLRMDKDVPHPPEDRRHMNRRYGAEVLAELFLDLAVDRRAARLTRR